MRLSAGHVAVALVLVASGATTVAATGVAVTPAGASAAARPVDDVPVVPAATAAVPVPTSSPARRGGAPVVPVPSATPRAVPTTHAPVRPLGALRTPDVYVTVPQPLTEAQVTALRSASGVAAMTVLDTGTVMVDGAKAQVVGVDPSEFRAFTPQETAASDGLWAAVARGEVAPSYGLAHERRLPLGGRVVVTGRESVPERVGAFAAFGLPDVDVVADHAGAAAYGVAPGTAVLVSAPSRSIPDLQQTLRRVVGTGAKVEVLRAVSVAPSTGRPGSYRELYEQSTKYCPGLSWTVLAAIGQVESDHGRNAGVSSAGAMGPMQFLPSTWAAYAVDGDGDGTKDIQSPYDAVPTAAVYLCRNGAARGGPSSLYGAIFAYNHADWYVRKVLAIAAQYG